MGYDWDAQEEVCRRLYVEEKRPLDDIVEYLRLHHNFTPSKRTLLSHFKKWGFPTKQNPAYKNDALVARIRELWETNVLQKDMLRILQDEGFNVTMRELSRVRIRNRWLLREPTEVRNKKVWPSLHRAAQARASAEADEESDEGSDESEEDDLGGADLTAEIMAIELDPAEKARREQRRLMLAAESAEKWASKKRRRRTRDWAGLPADPPGPPRYPSETTLEESKAILGLSSELYNEFRERFQRICEEEGVVKKTVAGPEKWDEVKEQLVREMPHLRSLLWDKEGMDSKRLAIDVICCDVTKRMRVAGKRFTLTQAKNILGLNPEQARETRFELQRILAEDKFATKMQSGMDRWKELKERWLAGSPLLQGILASESDESSLADKTRAVEALARDVMKRYRDDIARARKKRLPAAAGESGTEQVADTASMEDSVSSEANANVTRLSSSQSRATERRSQAQNVSMQLQARLLPAGMTPAQPDMSSIDPNLASSMHVITGGQQNYASEQQYVQQYGTTQVAQAAEIYHQPPAAPSGITLAIYFRLHPSSTVSTVPTMWISTLRSRSVEEVRATAAAKFPGSLCLAVEGLVKDGKGGEVPLGIPGDAELGAYLDHVQEMKGAPSFSVQLVRGWNAG